VSGSNAASLKLVMVEVMQCTTYVPSGLFGCRTLPEYGCETVQAASYRLL